MKYKILGINELMGNKKIPVKMVLSLITNNNKKFLYLFQVKT